MKIIIIGGSHAGLSMANFLHKLDATAEILLFEKTETLGFIPSTVNLILQKYFTESEMVRGETANAQDLRANGIQLFTNTEVIDIDPHQKFVTYRHKRDTLSQETASYDYLVLANGSEKFETTFPLPAERDLKLTTYKYRKDTEKTYPRLRDSKEVVIVGAGLIGLELAMSLCAEKSRHVTILERMDSPLFRYFDSEIIEKLLPVLPSNLTLLTNQVYYDIKQLPDDDKLTVTLEDESIIRADACVLALNPRPNSKLAKQAVDLDFDGSVLVNGYMQTSDPFIYAIGDLVKIPFMNGNERIYLPLIVNAKRESYIAAINILHGNHKEYPTSQRTIGTELFGHYFGSTGITESEAPFYNKKIQSITNTYDALSNYGALAEQYLRLKVIFEAGSKQILGVQLATNARQLLELVNLFAVVIEHRDTIEDLLNIDYYFAPKLSPLINLMGDIITKVYALENQAEK